MVAALSRPLAPDAGPRHWSLWAPTMVANWRRRLLPGAEGQPIKLLSDARSCFGKLSPDHPAARQEAAGHGRKVSTAE